MKLFFVKVTIYKTRAVVKTMLYLFGTHANLTVRIPNLKTHTENIWYEYVYCYTPNI